MKVFRMSQRTLVSSLTGLLIISLSQVTYSDPTLQDTTNWLKDRIDKDAGGADWSESASDGIIVREDDSYDYLDTSFDACRMTLSRKLTRRICAREANSKALPQCESGSTTLSVTIDFSGVSDASGGKYRPDKDSRVDSEQGDTTVTMSKGSRIKTRRTACEPPQDIDQQKQELFCNARDKSSGWLDHFGILTPQPELSDRLAKAFQHLRDLCRKASNDPF